MDQKSKDEIKKLIAALSKSNHQHGGNCKESRRIRRKLRKLGHYGGLRKAM
jgi:hypothetical protein